MYMQSKAVSVSFRDCLPLHANVRSLARQRQQHHEQSRAATLLPLRNRPIQAAGKPRAAVWVHMPGGCRGLRRGIRLRRGEASVGGPNRELLLVHQYSAHRLDRPILSTAPIYTRILLSAFLRHTTLISSRRLSDTLPQPANAMRWSVAQHMAAMRLGTQCCSRLPASDLFT